MQGMVGSGRKGTTMMTASTEVNQVKETLVRREGELARGSRTRIAKAIEKSADPDEIQFATERDLVIRNADSIIWR